MKKWLLILLFYASWYVAVSGAARGHPLWGPMFISVITVGYVATLKAGKLRETLFIGLVTLVGYLADTIAPAYGLVTFATVPELPFRYPFWLLFLWTIFATIFDTALRWLHKRYLLAACIGAIGGPLSYSAGVGLGAIHLETAPLVVYLINAVEWAILMPFFLKMHQVVIRK